MMSAEDFAQELATIAGEPCSDAFMPLIEARDAAIRADKAEAEADAAALRVAWLNYIEEYGIDHFSGCPEDDTCKCPLVAQINAAVSATAGRDLLARMERMRVNLEGRDKFIVDKGLWLEFLDTLSDAGGPDVVGAALADQPGEKG